jgi:hypothetical protein
MTMDIDLERLFRLRAAVGRFGEMDAAGWWNTQGVLGSRGAVVYRRGLPETHQLARVRIVTAVAADRSRTIYPAAGVLTLWSLPAALERSLAFQERSWATDRFREAWTAFDAALATPPTDLPGWLTELGLTEEAVAAEAGSLSVDPGGKGVAVPGPVTNRTIQLLALAHARGGPKNLVVPFIDDRAEAAVG